MDEDTTPESEAAPEPTLTPIERARAARARNQELRRQGLLPPLPSRKAKRARPAKGVMPHSDRDSRPVQDNAMPPVTAGGSLLSDDQLAEIRRKARERVEAELRTRQEAETTGLMQKVLEVETLKLRRAHGLTNHLDDIVKITINCPPYANSYLIDGTPYHHGFTYDVPRRVYNDLKEAMARGWDAEERAGWPNKKFQHNPALRGPLHTQNPMGSVKFDPNDGHIVSRETTLSAVGGVVAGMPTNTAMTPGL